MLSFKQFIKLPPEIRTKSIKETNQYIERSSLSSGKNASKKRTLRPSNPYTLRVKPMD